MQIVGGLTAAYRMLAMSDRHWGVIYVVAVKCGNQASVEPILTIESGVVLIIV